MKKLVVIILISLGVIGFAIFIFFNLFPKKYEGLITIYANKYSLKKAMVASVINIESSYKKDSVSGVGAIGLMQLLPTTAFDCANRLGFEIDEDGIFEPETNIELGCYYLSYLLDLFDENIINALCAYNWGLGNVKNWIELGYVDDSGTVTEIPVSETKNYIKKYKVNIFVYEKLYKF